MIYEKIVSPVNKEACGGCRYFLTFGCSCVPAKCRLGAIPNSPECKRKERE